MFYSSFFFFLQKNERIAYFCSFPLFWWAMWVNPSFGSNHFASFRSPKMSDHERFTQAAQRKWAMWTNRLFRSPKMSEWVNRSFFWANCSLAHFWTKNERLLGNQMSEFPTFNMNWINSVPQTLATFLNHSWASLLLKVTSVKR